MQSILWCDGTSITAAGMIQYVLTIFALLFVSHLKLIAAHSTIKYVYSWWPQYSYTPNIENVRNWSNSIISILVILVIKLNWFMRLYSCRLNQRWYIRILMTATHASSPSYRFHICQLRKLGDFWPICFFIHDFLATDFCKDKYYEYPPRNSRPCGYLFSNMNMNINITIRCYEKKNQTKIT